jgi:hypothetical protein
VLTIWNVVIENPAGVSLTIGILVKEGPDLLAGTDIYSIIFISKSGWGTEIEICNVAE